MNIDFWNLDTATIVAFMVSVVIPLVSALIGRAHWNGEVIGLLTLLIATVNGFLTEWASAGSGFNWKAAISTAGVSFLIAVAARYGLWKNTATDAKALAIGSRTAPAAPPAD